MKTHSARFYKVFVGAFAVFIVLSGLLATEAQRELYETVGLATKSAHVPRGVVYISAVLLTVAVILLLRGMHRKVRFIAVLCLLFFTVLFALSVRSWGVNNSTAEIGEYLGDYKYRHIVLEGINDEPYCYSLGPLFVRLQSPPTGRRHTMFRGVWPAYIGREQIERAFIVLSKCG